MAEPRRNRSAETKALLAELRETLRKLSKQPELAQLPGYQIARIDVEDVVMTVTRRR